MQDFLTNYLIAKVACLLSLIFFVLFFSAKRKMILAKILLLLSFVCASVSFIFSHFAKETMPNVSSWQAQITSRMIFHSIQFYFYFAILAMITLIVLFIIELGGSSINNETITKLKNNQSN